jgi:hypothetical protein
MAHFAKLNENNIVTKVIVVNNEVLLDSEANEDEQIGVDFCKSLYGLDTVWVQTSYNHNFRKQFAVIGFTYDSQKNKFIAPQPYPSWTLDSNDDWQAPEVYPDDGNLYEWNEETQSWEQTT